MRARRVVRAHRVGGDAPQPPVAGLEGEIQGRQAARAIAQTPVRLADALLQLDAHACAQRVIDARHEIHLVRVSVEGLAVPVLQGAHVPRQRG